MADDTSRIVTCDGCGAEVSIESATKIIVEKASRQVWTVLCGECAVVSCASCDAAIAVADILDDRADRWTHRQLIECDRCQDRVPATDAVELRRDQNRQYRKRLCGDCFQETPVPQGFTVIREFETESS